MTLNYWRDIAVCFSRMYFLERILHCLLLVVIDSAVLLWWIGWDVVGSGWIGFERVTM